MSIIFFDLDGTLAPVGMPVPGTVLDGMRELERMGNRIAVCSGRPLQYLCGLIRQSSIEHPILLGENGAVIQLGRGPVPEYCGNLQYSCAAEEAMNGLRRSIDERFGAKVWFRPNERTATCYPLEENLFDPIADLIAGFHPEEAGLLVYRHADCFDIIPAGIDKGAGVREVCRMLGELPESCTAVGDNINDIPMFGAVGRAVLVGSFRADEVQLRFDDIDSALRYLIDMEKSA